MSEFTGFGRTSDIDFGDYVEIEMHRYEATNEFYIHKVIGAGRSNGWVETPLKWNSEMVLHDGGEDVLNVIQCGCSETIAFKVNKKDCKKLEVKNGINYTDKHPTDEEAAVINAMRMGGKVEVHFFNSTTEAAERHAQELANLACVNIRALKTDQTEFDSHDIHIGKHTIYHFIDK